MIKKYSPRGGAPSAALALMLLTGVAPAASAQNTHTLPLVLPVTDVGIEGFVRVVNHSGQSGTVRIHATDDTGERFGPVTLDLDANEVANFRSRDLEEGNAARGLSAGVGDGEGNWRLELESEMSISALAYVRTADGFLTSIHDKIPEAGGRHHVLFFNPASNLSKRSRLRLINPGTEAAEVTVRARDDAGECAPGGSVRLTLPAGASRMLSAVDLESGGAGLDGTLGDGTGKWRLFVTSSVSIEAMSLLASPSGHLANLSTALFDAAADGCGGLSPGMVFRDCPECPEMVVVPGGSFLMGSPQSEPRRTGYESPVHGVSIRSFAVGKYEVTFDEWDACVLDGGCGGRRPEDYGWGGGRRPVIFVNWHDAKAYLEWLSGKTGQAYRLLSESEWEYAARAGTTGSFHTGSTITPEQANYDGRFSYPVDHYDENGLFRDRTLPVGSFAPNAFGLHDVHGNVAEWVEDCWNNHYQGAPTDGSAWKPGDDCGDDYRVLRGGAFYNLPGLIRSAYRNRSSFTNPRTNWVGFRVARTLAP